MHLDFQVRRKDEQRLQIPNVLFDAFSLMPVGPSDNDIQGVTFLEPVPFLIAEHLNNAGRIVTQSCTAEQPPIRILT